LSERPTRDASGFAAGVAAPGPGLRRRSRRWLLIPLIPVVVLAGVAALVAIRGFLLLDDARNLKADVLGIASTAAAAGFDLDRPTLDALQARMEAAGGRLDRLEAASASDPLIGFLATLEPTSGQVAAGRQLLGAARHLLSAGRDGLLIADRYVAIREEEAGNPAGRSVLADLVRLMATSHDLAHAIDNDFVAARATLAGVPTGLFGPLEDARVVMRAKVDEYGPLIHAYTEIDGIIPAILGWGGQKRYLVLAQNPAELRPTGGYIGTFGIVSFKDGRMVERQFHDVFSLDADRTYPYVPPPVALDGHLLGGQSWQLADANWSPDFPTSARDALRLYTNESGDTAIDGVIALTTYAIDDLLRATGPVTVPDYGVTVSAGQTTLIGLQQTRTSRAPGENRKAFLDAFAGRVIDAVLGLPPRAWTAMLTNLQAMGRGGRALVWLRDATAQDLVARFGWEGGVRQDAGDYLYAVDANVAPVSKLNAVTDRTQAISIALATDGSASHRLDLEWTNAIEAPDNAPYRDLPVQGGYRLLGNYLRVLTPDGSRFGSASGGSIAPLMGHEEESHEAGRLVFGSYVLIPPGRTSVHYAWSSEGVVAQDGQDLLYRLTIQRQPGTRDTPVAVAITVPAGARIVGATEGLMISGETATLATTLVADLQVEVRYRLNGK
jgi:hypothetical protein